MPVDIFSALADPTRRKILEMLAEHDRCPASEIHKIFPVSPQAISQHLKILLEANLISVEKKAQQRLYRLNINAMAEFDEWSTQVRLKWNSRLNALDAVLRAEMEKMTTKQEPKENEDEQKS
ncbi:ArsR/SmtB family transcription factor [Paenibacillus mendelii]|uniref:ArsR/SmtB family transcription factor n=1 Tax=Paenibacillus mendelii TaxID=206163 RepID=A0ABV6J1X4_9BACL|nr:metalloregulator ArsR/SmtB family transcription factor [Paenibacillus mendelii]MCQ6562807.1 metalloregulator ArsR/SmtB family transcription factor [Paenibacillus mendelii]